MIDGLENVSSPAANSTIPIPPAPVTALRQDDSNDGSGVVKKSNSRSAIWDFFRFMADTIGHAVDNGKLRRACFFKFQAVA